jgi:hypothetical protein
MQKMLVSAALIALLSASAASASDKLKPGLWSMTMKSDAMKNMPKMSPQQIEQMRKMGVSVPQMEDGAMVVRTCMTKEMVERDDAVIAQQNESGCKTKNYSRSGNAFVAEIVCDGPDIKGTGRIKGTYVGGESFSSTYDFKGTTHGQPINSHHETSGKWLGANCGDVKPVPEPARKK